MTSRSGFGHYEHHGQPLLSRRLFVRRLLRHALFTGAVILGSLAIGVAGYHLTEGLSWLDAFLNASMILGGMGPVDTLHTDAGKLFAGLYALYSGLVVLVAAGILLAPIAHRVLHRMHLPTEEDEEQDERRKKPGAKAR